MATWEDLDSESGSKEAEDEANVVVGLVATLTSEVEPDSHSEDENDVYSMLEQGCFTSHLLSFDNNKVLKIINWIC